MSTGNGHIIFDTLDDAAQAYGELHGEHVFIREQLRDIKTALDLILKTLKTMEEQEDADER